MNVESISKTLATTFGALIVSGVVFWLSYGQTLVSRTEAREMISAQLRESPYSQDRALLMDLQTRNTATIERYAQTLSDLKVQVGKLEATTDGLSKRVDYLIEHFEVKP